MAQALQGYFDDDADAAVRALWRRLASAGVPDLGGRTHGRHRPCVSFAVAGTIPASARRSLAVDLARLAVPSVWLYTLGTFPTQENALFLGAVTDAELLAVHVAVHDALAGRVRDPSAQYLPGAWVPHCTLAEELTPSQLTAGFAALHPIEPIRARITQVGITDTRTGDSEAVLTLSR
jgi:2'-5' RNA ligase